MLNFHGISKEEDIHKSVKLSLDVLGIELEAHSVVKTEQNCFCGNSAETSLTLS